MRMIEHWLVCLGLIDPTVKALADLMRDDPDTFTEHHEHDWRTAWLLHRSRVFSVICHAPRGRSLLPHFRVASKRGWEFAVHLSILNRVLLTLSWPKHLRPKRIKHDEQRGQRFA
ncbi:hypothetical protein [Burkholderia cepacia]|uniref:hypothetical protein n=1 Tax=Burkholderia cepacia TaxID=292 RepID=UPI00157716D0|nr:hypothetical protein [Burkholderia cepacia]